MSVAEENTGSSVAFEAAPLPDRLPFPSLTKQHILNCSYHSWHPRYRTVTPKARLVPLTPPFLSYLRADGIILPDDDAPHDWSDSDSGIFSGVDAGDDAAEDDVPHVAADWQDVHDAIKATIAELGGRVVPKLNWSAPKDATWISATNSTECRTPNDVYLLLKSSDFVTHDLEHPFDDCVDDDGELMDVEARLAATQQVPYNLVLRKWVQLNPSLEFRCFVRRRTLIAICQRDLNHFDFLFGMRDKLREKIAAFFGTHLKDSFPDDSFAFDVYIPPPHDRVWLVDINPWARRTDPLLFSWLELLTMPGPEELERLRDLAISDGTSPASHEEDDSEEEEDIFEPEFRLVRRDDPEAYSFNTPQYSAHKLPKEVVDASRAGEVHLNEFTHQWKELLERQTAKQDDDSEAD